FYLALLTRYRRTRDGCGGDPRAAVCVRADGRRRRCRPDRPARRGLRAARTQRSREDHDDPRHHHAAAGFYGIQIIWDRDAGVLAKLMVTPTPRAALVAGKAFAAGVRALIQALVVLILAAILGGGPDREPAQADRRGRGTRARRRVL